MSTKRIDIICLGEIRNRTPKTFSRLTIAAAVAACFSSAVMANPTNPTVVYGSASFAQAGNILNITNSHNAIINWGSFSIGVNELTRFIQPSALSAVLNRVTGQDPSAILGALQSNGRVFLINPNGIVFGANAQINVAGLVASTLNLSNDDFLNSRMKFTDGAGAGSVVNHGSITGGSVYLVGNAVTNNGLISSPNGDVILAAGNSVELVNPGTPNLRVEIVAPDNEARNLGSITADAGRIGIYAGLIHNSGTINASSAVAEGGKILLKAKKDITLTSTSVLDASGASGGEIMVLSDMEIGNTRVAGKLDASGTAGKGGFVETSAAKVKVDDGTRVITKGAAGAQNGKWLIDPTNYSIAYGGDISGATLSANLQLGDVEITTADAMEGSPGQDPGNISVNDEVSWNSGFSLMLLAHNDIQVNSQIANVGAGAIGMYAGWNGNLQMPAVLSGTGGITLNAPLSTSGDIYLFAGFNITQNSGGVIAANGLLANGGASGVYLGAAVNSVNTLAGKGGEQFNFQNDRSLTIGTLGSVAGVTVGNSIANTQAKVNVSLNGGMSAADLTVSNNITAAAGPGGKAFVSLSAGNGSIAINNAVVSATGGHTASAQGVEGSPNATVQLSASGVLTINSSTVQASGGNAYAGNNFGAGFALISADGTAVDIKNGSTVKARGGDGTADGSTSGSYAFIGITGNAAGGVSIHNSTIDSAGGFGLMGSQRGNAGIDISSASGSGNINIGSSALSANGYAATINFNTSSYGGNITLAGSSVTAQGRVEPDGAEGSVIFSAPAGIINTGSSSIGAFGKPGAGSGISMDAGGDIMLGLASSSDKVNVNTYGALMDGNEGLNVSAPEASLDGANGVGTIEDPIDTQVSSLRIASSNGGIGIFNSGNLTLPTFMANGNSAIGATGTMTVLDGTETSEVSGNLTLLAYGHLNIRSSVRATGNLSLVSFGSTTIGGSDVNNAVDVWGDASATVAMYGDLNVRRTAYGPSSLSSNGIMNVKTGGNVLLDQSWISGNPDVVMDVYGVVNINGSMNSGEYSAGVSAGSSNTIYLAFPQLASGGYFVNGIEGVIFDPAANSGFIVNGSPAVLGTSLRVIYGSLNIPTDALIVAMSKSTQSADFEKDGEIFEDSEKEREVETPVCR